MQTGLGFLCKHTKEVAFCSFFPKFEIPNARIVGMPLVYKVYASSPNLRLHRPIVFKIPANVYF